MYTGADFDVVERAAWCFAEGLGRPRADLAVAVSGGWGGDWPAVARLYGSRAVRGAGGWGGEDVDPDVDYDLDDDRDWASDGGSAASDTTAA